MWKWTMGWTQQGQVLAKDACEQGVETCLENRDISCPGEKLSVNEKELYCKG
jgi:hypothetical protein